MGHGNVVICGQAAEQQTVGHEMVRNWQQRAFRLAFQITRNQEDAEDAQQEAMLKAHRNLDQFQGRAQFTTWLSRIAINEALMCLRKRRHAVHVPLESTDGDEPVGAAEGDLRPPLLDPESAYSQREMRDLLSGAIAQLRPAHRTVFLLRALGYHSVTETARALGISASTVKARMRRARGELRRILKRAAPADRTGASVPLCVATSSRAGGRSPQSFWLS